MDAGLGLLVITRPHGETAAQLLQRMFATKNRWPELWELAAQNGHVSLLEWLLHNSPTLSENELHGIGWRAAERGQVAVLKWIAKCQPKYVFAIAHGHVRVHVHVGAREHTRCDAFSHMYIFVLIRM